MGKKLLLLAVLLLGFAVPARADRDYRGYHGRPHYYGRNYGRPYYRPYHRPYYYRPYYRPYFYPPYPRYYAPPVDPYWVEPGLQLRFGW